jgi:hypothetical protein
MSVCACAEPWPVDAIGNCSNCCRHRYVAGTKHDQGKRRYSLLPWRAVEAVVDVLEYGAVKYAPEGWRQVKDADRRYFDAALRHLLAWRGGERDDAESALPHLAHAACCVLFLLAFDKEKAR